MSDLEHRIKHDLEPVLALEDPRPRISAYHDMPYALFRYDAEDEFDLRGQVTLLETRLSQKGKRIKRISLAECLEETMRSQRSPSWFRAERERVGYHRDCMFSVRAARGSWRACGQTAHVTSFILQDDLFRVQAFCCSNS